MRKKIYIFGAHSRARTLWVYLQYLHPEIELEAYLYDKNEENPAQIDGIPVQDLRRQPCLHTENPVYIATRGMHHPQVAAKLKDLGVEKIYPVTVELDMELRNQFLKRYLADMGQKFIKIENLKPEETQERKGPSRAVYVAKSIFDSALQHDYVLAPYEKEIQVGAALTKERLYPGILTDDGGENISARNRQYCELTALYWLWKHAEEEIVGLVHYRRHFILPKDWLTRMQEYDVDVILPTPLYVTPSIEGNYKSRHDPLDWDFLMELLMESQRETGQEAKNFFAGNLYSPCNMFIMKREILNQFCSWLFPIVEAVVAHGGQKEDPYLNRYPGFLSERLLSFYFGRKSSGYKVVYADKNFLF